MLRHLLETIKLLMKTTGLILIFASLFSLFLCVERCSSNASKVEAFSKQMNSFPFGSLGQQKIKPAMPAISKYALFFAVSFGVAGVFMLLKSREKKGTLTDYMKVQSKQNSK